MRIYKSIQSTKHNSKQLETLVYISIRPHKTPLTQGFYYVQYWILCTVSASEETTSVLLLYVFVLSRGTYGIQLTTRMIRTNDCFVNRPSHWQVLWNILSYCIAWFSRKNTLEPIHVRWSNIIGTNLDYNADFLSQDTKNNALVQCLRRVTSHADMYCLAAIHRSLRGWILVMISAKDHIHWSVMSISLGTQLLRAVVSLTYLPGMGCFSSRILG